MNTKLHAVTDANGRPLSFFMTAGQVSDYTGAAALLDDLPKAQWLLGDRGYDADWFRDALEAKGIQPCIPGRKSRNEPVRYDRSEEHTSELQSLMRISYAVFCLKKKKLTHASSLNNPPPSLNDIQYY